MRNCIDITQLISEAQDRKLVFSESLEIQLHLMMCSGCRAYKHNIAQLKDITQQHNQAADDAPATTALTTDER